MTVVGNNIRFILHYFPIIVADITSIHNFWNNFNEEIVLKNLKDFVRNPNQSSR